MLLLLIGSACHKISPKEQVHPIMPNRMIAVAESCTGGANAMRFTSMPGASAYFLCGLITYNQRFERSLLHVPAAYMAVTAL